MDFMSRLEQIRSRIDGTAFFNQKMIKNMQERKKRLDGDTQSKGYKAEQRRAQDEKFVRDWINKQSELNLDPKKRFDLALKRGNGKDVEFIFDHLDDIGKFRYRVDTYTFTKSASTVDAKIVHI